MVTVSPERLESMQRDWVRLLAPFGVGAADAYAPFDALVAAYGEPHRHYHDLEHLAEMFRVAGRLAAHADDPVAVQLSIWFHDAVYDPRAKDNEARSAALATDTLAAIGVPAATVERVARLVHATAHLASAEPPADRDTAVLLDADLAILGAAEDRYRRYAADIRKEYAFVPENDYRKGRAAVLRTFLAPANLPDATDVRGMRGAGEPRRRVEGTGGIVPRRSSLRDPTRRAETSGLEDSTRPTNTARGGGSDTARDHLTGSTM